MISHDRYLQENSVASLESSILWADGFLLLYSVTQRISFLEIPGLKKLIDQTKKSLGKTGNVNMICPKVPCVVPLQYESPLGDH